MGKLVVKGEKPDVVGALNVAGNRVSWRVRLIVPLGMGSKRGASLTDDLHDLAMLG